MANVVKTATLTFNGDSYYVKEIPHGKATSCEAVDVTTCSDRKKKFVRGALKVNAEITVVIAGNVKPAINTTGNLSIVLDTGAVDCGSCICRSAEPVTIEADNASEETWTCIFQPTGR